MDRRNFIKSASLLALMATDAVTGVSRVFAKGEAVTGESGKGDIPLRKTMEQRNLGGLSVSAIAMGCVDFCPVGYYGCHNEKKDIIKLIRHAYDSGINLFDTAEIYGMNVSEEWLGEALEPIRDHVKIETKFGFGVAENQPGMLNSKPEHIRRAVEGSLRRLRTDHVDMLYQHRVDPDVPMEEVADTVSQLMQEGKVLHWGLSEASARSIRRAHAVCPLSAVESEYAIWWREPETKIFPTLEELGIGFVAYAPVGRGFLTGALNEESRFELPDRRAVLPRFTPEALRQNMALIRLMEKWARRKDVTVAQFALVWVLSQKSWIVPVPGTTKLAHLDELLGAKSVRLAPDELAAFDADYATISLMGARTNEAIERQIDK